MENFIKTVRDREQAELADRLEAYDTTTLLFAHNGDLPDVPNFECVRATTVKEVLTTSTGSIIAIGDENEKVAECIAKFADNIGVNIAVLVDVPGQQTSDVVAAALGMFKPISFLRVMNDLADKAVVESAMTQIELDESEARRQDARLRTKSGNIRPLIDFDRSFEEDVADDKQ